MNPRTDELLLTGASGVDPAEGTRTLQPSDLRETLDALTEKRPRSVAMEMGSGVLDEAFRFLRHAVRSGVEEVRLVGGETASPLDGQAALLVTLGRQAAERSDGLLPGLRSAWKLEAILKAMPAILIVTNAEGEVEVWNDAAEATLGTPSGDALGRHLADADVEWDGERIRASVDECLTSGSEVRVDELEYETRRGDTGLLGLSLTPIVQAGGVCAGALVLARDITERTSMERQLVQSEKMRSIGQLASGIAHEINTPAQFVRDNTVFVRDCFEGVARLVEVLRAWKENGASAEASELARIAEAMEGADWELVLEEVPSALDETIEGIGRIANIVSAMKTFAHPGGDRKEQVDVNELLRNAMTVTRNEWKYVAEIDARMDPEEPRVQGLPGELSQAFLNLIVNAAHAIQDKNGEDGGTRGTITVATRTTGEDVEVEISDTGCGIPNEIRERIFEPFFTTKEIGRGSGQGLALVHSVVVNKHGGELEIDSRIGDGTTFRIRLPVRAAPSSGVRAA